MKYLTAADYFSCQECQAIFQGQAASPCLYSANSPVLCEEDVRQKPVTCARKGTTPRCAAIQQVLQNQPDPLGIQNQRPLLEGCSLLAIGGGRFSCKSPVGLLTREAHRIPQPTGIVATGKRTILAEFLSISWIDERADLPGWDPALPKDGSGPPAELRFPFLDGGVGFRFAHRLSLRVTTEAGRIAEAEWLPTKQHYNPSTYYVFPPDAQRTSPNLERTGSHATIRSTVMSRTTAPEGLGGCIILGTIFSAAGPEAIPLGCFLGAHSLSQLKLILPPIWTSLALTVDTTGSASCELLAYSLFPSVSLYSRLLADEDDVATPFRRFSVIDCHENVGVWQDQGWRKGNPWGIDRGDTAER